VTTSFVPLVLLGGLTAAGVYLLLERNLTRMLLGLLLISNAINLLILVVGGPSGTRRSAAAPAGTPASPLIRWRRP